jgi:hypothetical protein
MSSALPSRTDVGLAPRLVFRFADPLLRNISGVAPFHNRIDGCDAYNLRCQNQSSDGFGHAQDGRQPAPIVQMPLWHPPSQLPHVGRSAAASRETPRARFEEVILLVGSQAAETKGENPATVVHPSESRDGDGC